MVNMTMVLTVNQPENQNFLSQFGFRFNVDQLPHVSYFCQNVTLPGLSVSTIEYPTPLTNIPYPGNRVTFQPLSITFRVDEEMSNWAELIGWLKGIGFPEDTDQYERQQGGDDILGSESNVFSDLHLYVLNNKHNPITSITFRNGFPTDLSGFTLATTDGDVNYLECTATFAYAYYNATLRDGTTV